MDRTLEEPMERRAVIYIHVPFGCGHGQHAPEGPLSADGPVKHRYMEALAREVRGAAAMLEDYSVSAIYVGGGSPSAMRPDDVARLLREVRGTCNLERGFELSFEAVPQTLCTPCMDGLKSGGVNRVCLRVPSADDAELERAGCAFRRADVEQAMTFLERFRMREVSLEVAYGMPGQDAASLLATLRLLMPFGADHVSLVPWGGAAGAERRRPEGGADEPDLLDLLAAQALPSMGPLGGAAASGAESGGEPAASQGCRELPADVREYLSGQGYGCYAQDGGVALFARKGRGSLYAKGCLEGRDVFGFGVGAVSLMGGVACANTGDLDLYLGHSGSFDQIVARAERVAPERLETYRARCRAMLAC